MTYDVKALRREEFPWADQRIYLDHASLGPLPNRTLKAVTEFNARRAVPFNLIAEDFSTVPQAARTIAAKLINADVGEIALAPNTSLGLALAARALPFAAGDIIIASDKEFPSNIYPWKLLKDDGVELEIVPCTPEGWPDEAAMLRRLADPKVKAVALSAVQFATGYQADLTKFSAETRRLGKYLLVDAIQAVGVLPVDVAKTAVDILACGGQKWLLSPWGSGFVYTRKSLVPSLRPNVASWLGYASSDDLTQLTNYEGALRPDARRLELTGHAIQDVVGFISSATMLHEIGAAEIAKHVRSIHAPVIAAAAKKGIPLATPTDARGSCTLSLRPKDPAAVHTKLREGGVHCSVREGVVRLSPHCYNTMEEMERVASLL